MARSLKKGPYVEAKLDAKVASIIAGKGKKGVIKTWSRRSTITPDFMRPPLEIGSTTATLSR